MFRLDRILLIIGIVCLGLYVGITLQTYLYQEQMEETFEAMSVSPDIVPENKVEPPKAPTLTEGDLVGRLEIPRLNISVMVLEGIQSRTLRLGAGHIPGTSYPGIAGNIGIAAHRDTFFRPLSSVKENDVIKFSTPNKTTEYRVVSTSIVSPDDVEVLRSQGKDKLTLVTCYPFYYIGPAPKRFIVTAEKE
jgi:sortase A